MPSLFREQAHLGTILTILGLLAFAYMTRSPGEKTLRLNRRTQQRQVPDFSWTDLNNRSSTLSKLKGRVVVLHFWADWCAPCLTEMPELARFESQFSQEPLEVLAFHVESTNGRPFDLPASQFPRQVIYDFDRTILNYLDVSAIPVSYILDRNGAVYSILRGPQDWKSNSLLNTIRTLIQRPLSSNMVQTHVDGSATGEGIISNASVATGSL